MHDKLLFVEIPVSFTLKLKRIYQFKIQTPTHFLKGREQISINSFEGQGSEKLKKVSWKYGAGTGHFKRNWGGEGEVGWHFCDLIFSRFIIYTFWNYFSLWNCYAFVIHCVIHFCYSFFSANRILRKTSFCVV